MSPTEVEIDGVHFETVDINVIPDSYVTWIVDIWEGDRRDPAVAIGRYIGVWRGEQLEDKEGNAVDPDFSELNGRSYSYERNIKPRPMHWSLLEEVKTADRDAENAKHQHEALMSDGYSYGSETTRKKLYKAFMEAIDVLGDDPNNETAWEAVEAWRSYQAHKHEK